MSGNEVKISQEFYNRLLDAMEKVERIDRSLVETRSHLRNAQLKIKELENKILQHNTSVNFNDIFRQAK